MYKIYTRPGMPNRYVRKLLLIMRLTTVLLIAAIMQVSATVRAQRITISEKNVPLEKVFKEIRKQSGYDFVFDRKLLQKANLVNLELSDAPLEEVLKNCFVGQPFTYTLDERTVVVKEKTRSIVDRLANFLNKIEIKGRVLDEKGLPLPGAIVKVKGSRISTNTNKEGEFVLQNVDEQDVLIISFIGYVSKELPATQNMGGIRLQLSDSKLDEVQVIGYSTTTQRLNTGNVSTITAKEIEKQPVTNSLQALSGRMPGVLITENSGSPGAGINIQIRAAGALNAGTNPLYIVDGVPYVSESLVAAGGNTAGASSFRVSFGSSPLNAINPSDIESIDILKDADATAIYGSRGSNGVILITTKKGKAGKSKFDVSIDKGFGQVADLHRVQNLSLSQYLEIRNKAFSNDGLTPTTTNAPDLKVWDQNASTDFQDLLFGNTAQLTNAFASFSGGSEQTTFLLSGAYHKEDAVVIGDNNYGRGAVHMNFEHRTLDNKFTATVSTTYVTDKNTNIARLGNSSDLANIAYAAAPNLPLYDPAGNLYWFNSVSSVYTNPLAFQYQKFLAKNENLIGNITLKYTPIKGLNLKLSTGYNKLDLGQRNLNYSKAINPNSTTLPYASFQQNYSQLWNAEPTADYTTMIGKGKMVLLAGATFQSNKFVQPYYLSGTNYSSDDLLTNPGSAGTITVATFDSQYKYASVFGRVNYDWMNKYILNINYRWDTSSKFGINKRSGGFASVGGAWIFTEEELIKDKLSFLSFGKLRASYGTSGNDQISNYEYYATYSPTLHPYNGISGLIPSKIENPDLKWEVNRKMEAAIDLGFLKDRILFTAAWFRNRTGNSLVRYPLSNATGFPDYVANLNAVVQQQGLEFTLTTQNFRTKDFSWTTSFNISNPQSKLISFPGISSSSYSSTKIVGESMSAIYGYQYTGINASTNLPGFVDADGNGVLSTVVGLANYQKGDYVKIGKTDPAFYGGLTNTLQYKGLQLDFTFQFVGKRMIPGIGSSAYSGTLPGSAASNLYSGIYDLFQATNGKIASTVTSNSVGTAAQAYFMYTRSDAVVSNAAYIRLKNVSLTYALPSSWLDAVKISGAQIYLRGQNLFTATNFEGFDPESLASNIPPLRMITAGIKFSL